MVADFLGGLRSEQQLFVVRRDQDLADPRRAEDGDAVVAHSVEAGGGNVAGLRSHLPSRTHFSISLEQAQIAGAAKLGQRHHQCPRRSAEVAKTETLVEVRRRLVDRMHDYRSYGDLPCGSAYPFERIVEQGRAKPLPLPALVHGEAGEDWLKRRPPIA